MTFASKSACLIASLSLVLSGTPSRDVRAAGDSMIQRCEADDGIAVYTDKPCSLYRAQPTRLSDDLAIRLAMAEAADAATSSVSELNLYRDASEPLDAPSPGRRSVQAGCARTPQQLSRDLVGAFALHDVNRVAESYHWAGMTQRRALPVMQRLEDLSARRLTDARYMTAWISSAEESSPNAAIARARTDPGLMQLVFAGGERVVDFPVRRYSGCYFIAS